MDNIVIELFLLSIGASFVQRTTGFGFGRECKLNCVKLQ